jgi:predicted TIM-barrel fold metal-dependent hydrolase
MLIDGFTLFGSWPGLPYDHQVDELVNGLDRFKITRACTLSSKGIFFDAAEGNETTWSISQQYERLIPIGVADPREGGVEQVEYCQAHNFRLMALFPALQGWGITSLAAKAVLQAIDAAQLPVMIQAEDPADLSTVLAAVENLSMPVIFLGVTLRTLTEAITAMQQRPNSYLTTRLLCGGDTIEYVAQTVGAERMIFTSRFPISCFSSAYLAAKFANVDDAAQRAILGENIARLLKLS